MPLEEQQYTKLKKFNPLQKYGFDSSNTRYEFNYMKNRYERKIGKKMFPKSPRVKILRHEIELDSRSFHAFDVETKDGLKGTKLFCWALSYRSGMGSYKTLHGNTDLSSLFEYFLSCAPKIKKDKHGYDHKSHKQKIIFVHNLTFDIRFIIEYCIKNNISFKPIISGSNFIACILDELEVKFVDTLQFLKVSQEDAEIEWDIEKKYRKEITSSVNIFEKDFKTWSKAEKENVRKHNKNDVIALHKIMVKFRETMADIAGIDMLQSISLASVGMKALRTTLKDTQILNPFLIYQKRKIPGKKSKVSYKIDGRKEKFVRQSYYGGRNELFILGKQKLLDYIDRVSMYPAEMKFQLYPSGIPFWLGNFKEEKEILMNIIEGKDERLGFIEAIIEKGNSITNFPVLPKRVKGVIMFTDCTLRGIYTSVELAYAHKMGNKITPIKGLIYPMKENYFTPFVDKFFKVKKQHKGGKKHTAKIILNASYGKFGQSFERDTLDIRYFIQEQNLKEYLMDVDEPEKAIIRYNQEYRMFLCMTPRKSISKKRFMNVAIASFITSYSRLALLYMFHMCENYLIRVFYGDTDSFTISEEDKLRLMKIREVKKAKVFSDDLGGWNVENHFEEVEFVAPKIYISIISGKLNLKMKGVGNQKIKEIIASVEKQYIANPKLDRIKTTRKIIAKKIVENERYMTFKSSFRSGYILATKIPYHTYGLENNKRNFNKKTGESIPWNDNTIEESYKDDLITVWDESKIDDEVEYQDLAEN